MPLYFLFCFSFTRLLGSGRYGRVCGSKRQPQPAREETRTLQTPVDFINSTEAADVNTCRGASNTLPPRHGTQLGRLGSSSPGPCLVPTGCMRRACADALLHYCFNVSPGFGVPFRDPAPVSPWSRQRGSAPPAQHGPEPGRRVPTGAARYERKPQCGEISHIHLCLESVLSLPA